MENYDDYFYVLGLLLSKGKAQVYNKYGFIDLIYELRFNKPTSSASRSDNKHNNREDEGDEMYDFILPDIIRTWNLLEKVFAQEEVILEHIPEPISDSDFSKKTVRWVVRKLSKTNKFIEYFWDDINFDSPQILDTIPKRLLELQNKAMSGLLSDIDLNNIKSYLVGISDAAAIIPGPESSAFGAGGTPRIQIEVDNSRWKLNIVICTFLQRAMKVPVLNINWPHPTIKGREGPETVLKHNHQFRAHLWFFKKVGFRLSIKQVRFDEFIKKIEGIPGWKEPKPTFHPHNRKNKKYVSNEEYKKKYPDINGLTTTPYFCTEHCENSETLPKEIRGKHYAEWRDINFDLGDPELSNYASEKSKYD